MKTQTVLYTGPYRYEFYLKDGGQFTIARDGMADLLLPKLKAEKVVFRLLDQRIEAEVDGQKQLLEKRSVSLAGLQAYVGQVSEPQVFDLAGRRYLSIGGQPGRTLSLTESQSDLSLVVMKEDQQWQLVSSSLTVYHNNKRLNLLPARLDFGDELSFEQVTFKFYEDEVWILGASAVSTCLQQRESSRYKLYSGYPVYHRSPQLSCGKQEGSVSIAGPTALPRKPKDVRLALGFVLMLLMALLLFSLFNPVFDAYLYWLAVGLGLIAVVLLTVSVVTRYNYKKALTEREEHFQAYLLEKSRELHGFWEKERRARVYHAPAPKDLLAMAKVYHHRLYERISNQPGFLNFRLGVGHDRPSFGITYTPLKQKLPLDRLAKTGLALCKRYTEQNRLPLIANLLQGPLVYTGPRSVVLQQVHLMLIQLAFFHSYHDLRLFTLVPEEEETYWSWIRWLPHATDERIKFRGIANTATKQKETLDYLHAILKARMETQLQPQAEPRDSQLPHYVLTISDPSVWQSHPIKAFLGKDLKSLGYSLVFIQEQLTNLSEQAATVVEIKGDQTGCLVRENGVSAEKFFELDYFAQDSDKEQLARLLAPLQHLEPALETAEKEPAAPQRPKVRALDHFSF